MPSARRSESNKEQHSPRNIAIESRHAQNTHGRRTCYNAGTQGMLPTVILWIFYAQRAAAAE